MNSEQTQKPRENLVPRDRIPPMIVTEDGTTYHMLTTFESGEQKTLSSYLENTATLFTVLADSRCNLGKISHLTDPVSGDAYTARPKGDKVLYVQDGVAEVTQEFRRSLPALFGPEANITLTHEEMLEQFAIEAQAVGLMPGHFDSLPTVEG